MRFVLSEEVARVALIGVDVQMNVTDISFLGGSVRFCFPLNSGITEVFPSGEGVSDECANIEQTLLW